MKGLIVLIVALIVLSGGYYWYSSQETADTMDDMSSMEAMDMSTSDTNTDAMDAMPATNSGTGVNVNAGASVSTGAVKEFTVTGTNFAFAPAAMTVKQGDTVRITFVNGGGTHDFVIDEFNARTKVIQGGATETIEFVADKTGSFEYYCSVGQHREMGMKGTLTVQ